MTDSNVAKILQDTFAQISHCVITNVEGQTENRSKVQVSILFKDEETYRVAFHDDPVVALGVALFTKRGGLPVEPGVRYWHDPKSGSVLKTGHRDRIDAAHVEEIDRDTYASLLIQYGLRDEPIIPPEGAPAAPKPPPLKPEQRNTRKAEAKKSPPVEVDNDYDDIL